MTKRSRRLQLLRKADPRSDRLVPTKRNSKGRDLDPNYDNVEVYINSLLPTPG